MKAINLSFSYVNKHFNFERKESSLLLFHYHNITGIYTCRDINLQKRNSKASTNSSPR